MSNKSGATRQARSAQLKAEREAAKRASERRSRLLIAIAVLAAVGLVAVAVVATRTSGSDATATDADVTTPAGVTSAAGGVTYGDEAPVVLDEWFDFACPACKVASTAFAPTIDELVADGDLQVVYHPLSFLTPGSPLAANAFGCAVDEGAGHDYYTAVFEAQGAEAGPGFTNDQLISIGEQVGLTSETFASCVNDGTYDGWVSNVAQSGVDEGVNQTPTFFVNGEQVQLTAYDPQQLLDAITAAQG